MNIPSRLSFARWSVAAAIAALSAACGVDATEPDQAPAAETTETAAAPLVRVVDGDTATTDIASTDTSSTDTTSTARAKWCSMTTDGGQWCCSTDANGKLYCWKVPPPDTIWTLTRY